MANVILDQFGRDTKLTKVDAEHFDVSVDVAVSDQFLGWVIALGDGVTITGPEEIVENMKIVLKRMIKRYR